MSAQSGFANNVMYAQNVRFDGASHPGQITSDGQLLIGSSVSPNIQVGNLTSSDGSIVITNGHGTINLSASPEAVSQKQIFYVAKSGNNSNTGTSINQAVLTFGQAITLATAQTPSATNQYVVYCCDDGVYTENITGLEYVDIFAPNASIVGTLTLTDYEYVKFKTLTYSGSGYAITKSSGTTYLDLEIDTITLGTSTNGLSCSSGFTNFTWKQLYVVNGYGIGNYTGGETHIHLKGGDIYVSGTGYALTCVGTNSMVGRIDHILDNGTGVGHGILCVEGEIDLNVSRIESLAVGISVGTTSLYSPVANLDVNIISCTEAYAVGSTGTLNLCCGNITGTTSVAGTLALAQFSAPGTTGTVLTGNTGANPSFSSTPTVSSITISNAPVATTDGTNKAYVDAIAAGIEFKDTTQAASTGSLTVTYFNGVSGVGATLTNAGAQAAFAIDGYTASLNDRILIKNQSSTFQNGIYSVTVLGTSLTNWVLTRTTDYDTPAQMPEGSVVPVQQGTVNANTLWLQNVSVSAIGSGNPITYQKFQSAPISTTQNALLVGTANNGVGSLANLTNGQIVIGSTGNPPQVITPTATSGGNLAVTANATTLSYGISAPVSIANGGTNATSITNTDGIVYFDGTRLVDTAAGTSGQVLLGNTSNPAGWVTPTSGTGTSVTANATTLSWGLSTPVSVTNGGTGAGTFTADGVLYGNTTSAIGVTAAGTNGQVFLGNTSNPPGWVTPTATSGGGLAVTTNATTLSYGISAPVSIANGGTNATSMTNTDGVCYFDGTRINTTAVGTSGYILTSNGAGNAPTFQSSAQIATITLNSNAIKTLNASPTVIVAAQGTSTVIPISLSAKYIYGGSNVFTGGANITCKWSSAAGTSAFGNIFLTSAITGTANVYSAVLTLGGAVNNQPLVITSNGPDYGGNAAGDNSIEMTLFYYVSSF
jgi:hypothetical protein